MDKSGINELLNRIKKLEAQNALIKEEINSKYKEISSKTKYISYYNSRDNNNLYKEEDNKKSTFQYHDLINNEDNIKANVLEYTVEYISFDNHTTVYIMGDFNNWEMQPMYKTRGVFKYHTILLKGFKYYYTISFENADSITIDINQPSEINPITKTEANYINLNHEGKKESHFNYNQLGNILSLQRKNLLMIKAGNWNEVAFMERLPSYIDNYLTQSNALEYNINLMTTALNELSK